MRPIKLTMSAFGPYAGETVVEFDKLGENGIYLITGDTGAGKTTIFDAIVFALYNDSSSEKRKTTMFRSKYAKPETPTFVELIFKYNNKEYKIKRIPYYLRPKLRSTGFTEQHPACELTFPDGNVLTRKTEVDSAINEIIGITKDQFLQIAMIAQGDFLKLLIASTPQRIEIFRRIFKTERYLELQNRLKADNKTASEKVDKARNSMKQYIDGIICSEESIYFTDIEKAKNGELPVIEVMLTLEKMISQDENSDKELTTEINEIEKQLAEVNSNLGKIEELNKSRQELTAVTKILEVKTEDHTKLKNILDVEKEKFSETESLTKEIAKIRAELPRYDELEHQHKKIRVIETKLKTDEKSLSDKTILLDSKREILDKLKEEKASLEKAGELKEKLTNEKSQAEQIKKKLDVLTKSIRGYKDISELLEEKQKCYLNARDVSQKATDDYNAMNIAFLNEQAGILAEQLEENSPCPVCGSTNHPQLAQKSKNAPSEAELKTAKMKSEKAQDSAAKASNECSQIRGQAETAKSNIEQQLQELVGNTDISSAEEKVNELIFRHKKFISKLKLQISDEEKKISRKNELEEIIPETESKLENLTADISTLRTNVSTYKATIEEITEQLSTLKSNLCFEDKKTAEKKQSELEIKAETLKKSLEKAQNNFDSCEKEVITLDARAKQLKKHLENATQFDEEAVREKQKTLIAQKSLKTDAKQIIHTRLSANTSVLENVRKKTDEINVLEKNYALIRSLSDTASGTVSDKEKIMLETYIQMTYFERIIARANIRFMVMTGGQYEMKRRAVSDNNKSQSGLDIDIIDHYNGTERSVKTLSGGESFKASLSLALGLSDEIQASAGGIRLDTMFVDEGFGSLDDESLNQAMNALKGLTEGNRLVGIISHVSELKEKIDKQIVITKEKLGGSKVNILT